jgi:hypothetical protein
VPDEKSRDFCLTFMNSMEDRRRNLGSRPWIFKTRENPGSRPWTFDDHGYQLWGVKVKVPIPLIFKLIFRIKLLSLPVYYLCEFFFKFRFDFYGQSHATVHLCAAQSHATVHLCAAQSHATVHLCAAQSHATVHLCAAQSHATVHLCAEKSVRIPGIQVMAMNKTTHNLKPQMSSSL